MTQIYPAHKSKAMLYGCILFTLCFSIWIYAIFFAISESHQGDVYRIIYLHVPSAFSAFFCSLLLFVVSLMGLKNKPNSMLYGKAVAELGLLFTCLTLVTGSIWGKPTWGVWWTWDARLTTTFILALLYSGYLLLWSAMNPGQGRNKVCSVLGILIFADVPIIYKSVSWWRTLHQPPSLMRVGGPSMAPEIFYLLIAGIVSLLGLTFWMIWHRTDSLKLSESLEQATYLQLQKEEKK